MRRLLLVLTVALIMAAMVAAMTAPAFADKGGGHCFTTSTTSVDRPTPLGCTEPHQNTAIYTFRGPEEAPGSSAQGGKPGFSDPIGSGLGACHGPHC